MSKTTQRHDDPVKGILLSLIAIMCFAAMSTMVKQATQYTPTGQIVFFRSFFAMLPVIIFAATRSQLRTILHTKRLGGHLIRTAVGVTSMYLGFWSLYYLPLAEATAIGYATPLFMVFLAAFFLGETVRRYRWSAVALGFVGIAIILAPVFDFQLDADHSLGALIALAAALFSACAAIQIRQLVDSESSNTIVLYFSLFSSIAALFSLPFGWVALSFDQSILLIAAGLLGGVAQIFHTQSFRFAEASLVAVFQYTSMIWASLFGYVIFEQIPALTTWIGTIVVICAGIFVIMRERALGKVKRRKSPLTM